MMRMSLVTSPWVLEAVLVYAAAVVLTAMWFGK